MAVGGAGAPGVVALELTLRKRTNKKSISMTSNALATGARQGRSGVCYFPVTTLVVNINVTKCFISCSESSWTSVVSKRHDTYIGT